MTERKQYPLRIDPQVWSAVQRWAADDFRSVNAQVEWILRDALRRSGRLKGEGDAREAEAVRDDGEETCRPDAP